MSLTPQSPIQANNLLVPIDGTADLPSIRFGGNLIGNNGTGIYGDFTEVSISIQGDNVLTVDATGMHLASGLSILGPGAAYSGADSFQPIGPDLELAATAGSADGADPSYLAPIMGNLLGADLTKDANYLGGVIGAFSVTGVKETTYPAGAVLAQITDGVTEADGAVVAYIDGDGSVTTANAAFKAMSNNSTPGSGFNYGVDLQGDAHDGYNALAILKADVRTASGAVIMTGAGAPSDGTTGDDFAGTGSLYIDTTNGVLYIQTSLISTPVWVVVGTQS